MRWISLLLPLGYLTILLLSLATFSHLYRRRKALASTKLEPWFPPHLQRQVYLSLLEVSSSPTSPQKVPDSVLRAALLRRATEDIHRLVQLRNSKPALSQLLQRGAVGDELWQRFLIAEKEMDAELRDVVGEANALAPQQNWGQVIFQSGGEMAHAEHLKGKLKEIESERTSERESWERRKEMVKEGFLKEIEGDTTVSAAKMDGKAEKKPGSSDEEAVLVEAGGPGAPGVGGGGKKKKGKK